MRENSRLSMILIPLLPPRAEPAGCFWSGGIPGEKKQEGREAGWASRMLRGKQGCQRRDGGIKEARGGSRD